MSLNLSGETIEQMDKVKLLCIIIDSQLSWAEHIDAIVKKMGNGISMVRKCLPYVPAHIVEQVMKSLVLSHLDYCAPVWSSASKSVLNKFGGFDTT